ncbi:MAG: RluA family pseudouridine synthase [Candidatus Adiutrix sp.]|jgi:23S rRNA-/tRNA-specific pseudouridylate synthase|nr:RluA family pseudouridine synthase [Candidatus Adiutrix sp.]
MLPPAIIYEDNHLLIVQKPPGYMAQPDGGPRPDLLTWARGYLGRAKTGRAFVGLIHRLDQPVGGVTALAKTSKGAARLSRQFRERTVDKIYLALIQSRLEGPEGRLDQTLIRDGHLTRPARPGEEGRPAVLEWRPRRSAGGYTLLEIKLLTGFKHQIRAQLAALGRPVAGDYKYGSRLAADDLADGGPAIGLWAESLSFDHPVSRERLRFTALPPAAWPWTLLD